MPAAFPSDRLAPELAAFLSVPDRPPRESADRLWDELRTSYPIVWHGPHLILSRHADFKSILRDPRFGKDGAESTEAAAVRARLAPEDAEIFDELFAFESTWMVRAPTTEQHDRLRRVAHRAFTPRHVDAMRDSVERHLEELLRPLERGGVVDFTTISYRLPLAMITDPPRCSRPRPRGRARVDGTHLGGTQPRPRADARGGPRAARVQGIRPRDR
jgi:cytochrome P450